MDRGGGTQARIAVQSGYPSTAEQRGVRRTLYRSLGFGEQERDARHRAGVQDEKILMTNRWEARWLSGGYLSPLPR